MFRLITFVGTLLAVVTLLLTAAVGCATGGPVKSDEVALAQAQVEIARYQALEKEYEVEGIEKEADAHVRKVTAETSNRILEMHEIVTADMERLMVMQNTFVDAVNNHQAAMVNQSYLLQQQFNQMQAMEYNIHAAAENSWFSNILMVLIGVVLLGLIGLTIGLGLRFEKGVSNLAKRLDETYDVLEEKS